MHFAVPMGTVVHQLIPIVDQKGEAIKPKKGESSLDCYTRKMLADLSLKDEEVKVAKGGMGGKGKSNLIRKHK